MKISPALKNDFNWWQLNIMHIYKPINKLQYSLEIFTDSSLTGWGACYNDEKIHGFWSAEERTYHINYLELLAAFFGLKSFAKDLKSINILLRIDNSTTITYINRMGGIQSEILSKMSKNIWEWCETRNIWLYASYIPSKDNSIADFESRRLEPKT